MVEIGFKIWNTNILFHEQNLCFVIFLSFLCNFVEFPRLFVCFFYFFFGNLIFRKFIHLLFFIAPKIMWFFFNFCFYFILVKDNVCFV